MSYSSLRKACKPCYKEAWHPMPHGERPSYWYCPLPDAPLSHGSASSVCPRTYCGTAAALPYLICVSQNPLQESQLLLPASSSCPRTHCRNSVPPPSPACPRTTAGTAAALPYLIHCPRTHCRNAAALPLPPYPRTTAGTAAPPPLFISAFFGLCSGASCSV